MIKLDKIIEPEILKINAVRWTRELVDAITRGDKKEISSKKSRYNHDEIKKSVIAETHGKCAYCESKVRAVAHGDIEHVQPKSLDYSRCFEWGNLGFSCQICNQNKSDKDPAFEKILDPYNIDPNPYIIFCGPFINGNGSEVGKKTIFNLKLDRVDLWERREGVFKEVMRYIDMIKMARSQEEYNILFEDFESNELGSEKEFSAMRRSLWSAYKPEAYIP